MAHRLRRRRPCRCPTREAVLARRRPVAAARRWRALGAAPARGRDAARSPSTTATSFIGAARGRRRRARRSIPARARRSSGWRRGRRRCSASPPARRGAGSTTSSPRTGSARFFATAQTADDHPVEAASLDAPRRARRDRRRGRTARSMVGDTEFDIAMGRAAGMATIGVAWGYHPRARLAAAGADAIIDELRRARRGARPAPGAPPMSWTPRRRFWQRAGGPARGRRLRRRPRRAAAADPGGRRARRADRGARRGDRRRVGRARGRDPARAAAADPRRQLRDRPGRRRSARRSSTRSPTTAAPTCSATAPRRPRRSAARQAAGWDPWLRWAARTPRRAAGRGDRRHAPSRSRRASLAALRAAVAAEDAFGARRRCTSSSRSRARSSSASRSRRGALDRRRGLGALAARRDLAGRAVGPRLRGRGGRRRAAAPTSSAPRGCSTCSPARPAAPQAAE